MITKFVALKIKYNRLDTGDIVTRDVLSVAPNGSATFLNAPYAPGFFPSEVDGKYNLGNTFYCFGTTYTQKLNAGSQDGVGSGDLIVPTEGGTLARLEDITATVGDISSVLDAINGEAI